jgi:hypothetical protein
MSQPERHDSTATPSDLLHYVRRNWVGPSVTSMLTGDVFTSPDGYAAHLAEHGCELARDPAGAPYLRLPPRATEPTPSEQKTPREQAIELEAGHAARSMRQRGEFRLAPAQIVADAVGVSRRTIERWRKDRTYDIAIMAACVSRRIDARRRRRTD